VLVGCKHDWERTPPPGAEVRRDGVGEWASLCSTVWQLAPTLVKQAAKTAGISADLGTHTGRRTVVTTLFVDGDESLEDIARFVGHARPATTAGYVKRLGRRPESVARRAAAILDGDEHDQGDNLPDRTGGVRNHAPENVSNGGSNRPTPSEQALPDGGP
jgi:hypothetical protein